MNDVNLFVNNKQIDVDNFVYNDTTYVPLRAVAEMNNMKIKWNSDLKRVDLIGNEAFCMKSTDEKYNIKNSDPKYLSDANYFKWGYLDIIFDSNVKKMKDNSEIVLIDCKGNRFEAKGQPGTTAKNNFLIIPKNELALNTYYSLYIPKDNIIMENGDLYGEEILIYFKTATNAIRGQITSKNDLFGKKVVIKDIDDTEYTTYVVGKNEFYFSNIPAGKYNIAVEGHSYGSISVQDNIVNDVKVIEK